MPETIQEPRLDEMHPIIRWSLEGGESTYELGTCMRKQHPTEKTALEVRTKIEGKHTPRVRFDILFIIESQGTTSFAGLSFGKPGGSRYGEVMEDAKRLARDLRKTYALEYTPNVYFEGALM